MAQSMQSLFSEGKGKHLTDDPRKSPKNKAEWQTLQNDVAMSDWQNTWIFAAGSKYKAFETSNHGWVVFAPNAMLTNDYIPVKHIFKD